MTTEPARFEIRTLSGSVLCSRSGRLRDAIFEIHHRLNPVEAVLSAFGDDSPSKALVTGYLDSRGRRLIHRYLHANSGDEFENWLDAQRNAGGSLPGDQWRIGAQFSPYPPTSGIVGHAVLQVDPFALPVIDFARESGIRRLHYGGFTIDVASWKTADQDFWATNFVVRSEDGRALGPMSIHAIYKVREHAIFTTMEHARLLIDAGITMPEVTAGA